MDFTVRADAERPTFSTYVAGILFLQPSPTDHQKNVPPHIYYLLNYIQEEHSTQSNNLQFPGGMETAATVVCQLRAKTDMRTRQFLLCFPVFSNVISQGRLLVEGNGPGGEEVLTPVEAKQTKAPLRQRSSQRPLIGFISAVTHGPSLNRAHRATNTNGPE